MHVRKTYLIYSPTYVPGDKFKVRYSKLQAWKAAVRLGEGSTVFVEANIHPSPRQRWVSSVLKPLWDIYKP